jgi:hypothetical protein
MKKILFFDSWTGGIHNFSRLNFSLKTNGINPLLIHLSSWEKNYSGQKEEIINGLLTRDVSYYGDMTFNEIIELEKPDIVLLLSVNTFAHWAFVRLCSYKNIPTVFLFCGLLSVQSGEIRNTGSFKLNYMAYFRKVFLRLPRLFSKVLPVYISSLNETNAGISDWLNFIKMIVFSATSPSTFKSLKNVRTTTCNIYAKSDMASAMNLYGYQENEITVVGNPDFIQFGFDDINHLKNSKIQQISNDYVIYIDTALLASGYYFKDIDEFMCHLLSVNKEIQKIGKKLIFKPHPDTAKLIDLNVFSANGILIIGNSDLFNFLNKTYCVLTEPSTLSIVPCALGIPLLLVNFGKLRGIKFGSSLLTYPLASFIEDVSDLDNLVKQLRKNNFDNELREWKSFNVGPTPFNEMPQRVTQAIIKLL